MVPNKPPPIPSLDRLVDELEDIELNGKESAKHLLAMLVDGHNKQNAGIAAINVTLRTMAENFDEVWKFARDANRRAEANERRIAQVRQDMAKQGLKVEQTGSFIIGDIREEALLAQMFQEWKTNKSDMRRLRYSLREKIWFLAIVIAVALMGAGVTVAVYEIAHRGPSIPTLPGAP